METAAYFRYAQFAEIAVYFLDYVGDPGGIHGGQAFRHTYFVEGQGFSSVTVVMFVVMIVVMVVIMFVVVVMLVSMFMFMVVVVVMLVIMFMVVVMFVVMIVLGQFVADNRSQVVFKAGFLHELPDLLLQ